MPAQVRTLLSATWTPHQGTSVLFSTMLEPPRGRDTLFVRSLSVIRIAGRGIASLRIAFASGIHPGTSQALGKESHFHKPIRAALDKSPLNGFEVSDHGGIVSATFGIAAQALFRTAAFDIAQLLREKLDPDQTGKGGWIGRMDIRRTEQIWASDPMPTAGDDKGTWIDEAGYELLMRGETTYLSALAMNRFQI